MSAVPAVGRKPTAAETPGSSLSVKPGTTTLSEREMSEQIAAEKEITDLRTQLAEVKRKLLEEIALEPFGR